LERTVIAGAQSIATQAIDPKSEQPEVRPDADICHQGGIAKVIGRKWKRRMDHTRLEQRRADGDLAQSRLAQRAWRLSFIKANGKRAGLGNLEHEDRSFAGR